MAFLMISLFIAVQFALAMIRPAALIYLCLLTGAVPIALGHQGMLASSFGKLDLSAIRLLGLWFACFFVILLNLGRAWKYFIAYRFHFLFLLFCCFSLVWSPSLTYGLRMIAKLSAPFLFLVVLMLVISSHQQLRSMERLTLLGGVLILFLAIAGKATGFTGWSVGLTVPGTSPALFSAYMVAVGMLALANVKYENRSMNLILAACFSAAVMAGFTRITIAALFVGFSVILFLAFRGISRVFLPASGMMGLPALFLLNDTFKKRMFFGADKITFDSLIGDPLSIFQHLHGSGRFEAWAHILNRFFEPSPWVGSGIGATQNYYYSRAATGVGVIHSEYIRLLAEVGIVGLFLFGMMAAAYLRRLIKIYRKAPRSNAGKYALAGLGGLTTYLIFMATDNAFDYVNGFGIYVFALIGLGEKGNELQEEALCSPIDRSPEKRIAPAGLRGGQRYPIIRRVEVEGLR